MKKVYVWMVIFFGSLLAISEAKAQDFVYEPKNPSFGGQTFNYQWMLSSAEAQNKFKDPEEKNQFGLDGLNLGQDPVKDFASSLNRLILNNLASRIVSAQFGQQGVQPGQYILGNFQIDVTDSGDGISIVIVDMTNGNQTTVSVPTF